MRATLAALTLCLTASTAWAGDRYTWDVGRFEVGPRITQLTLTDDETDASLPMGGAGMHIRWRFSRRLGMEAAWDILASDELAGDAPGDVTRITVPVNLSGMLYLFPESRFQMYFLGGGGLAASSVRYEALGESASWAVPELHVGAGAQYRWNGVRLDFSARGMFMSRGADEVTREELPEGTFDSRSVDYQPFTGDRSVTGVMFTLGVHWGIGGGKR